MKHIGSYDDELADESIQANKRLRNQVKKKRKELIKVQRVNKYNLSP